MREHHVLVIAVASFFFWKHTQGKLAKDLQKQRFM